MRVLVLTTVHHPEDSRVRARQIAAMLDAGWDVTYAAPFSGYGLSSASSQPNLTTVDVPRAHGRHRARAFQVARGVLRRLGPRNDVVLVHDPELVLAVRSIGTPLPPVVWDVHEDTAAAVSTKPWLPGRAARSTAEAVRRLEEWAERELHLILAEHAYQDRFRRDHLVVPNSVRVPETVREPGDDTVVYIGSITAVRGASELIGLGRALREQTGGAVSLRLIGGADTDTAALLRSASADGLLRWDGFLPSAEAFDALSGALAGVSLLHDMRNYRVSMPTKVIEYMAHGVPVISTPLPLVERLLTDVGCGLTVPFHDVTAAAEAVVRLRDDADLRRAMGRAGHEAARWEYDWGVQSAAFLTELTRVARAAPGTRDSLT